MEIVTEQEAWLAEAAVTRARDILASHKDIDIIWSANEGGTVGTAVAVKNAGKAGKVFVFGTDISDQLLNMLLDQDDILQAVTGQQPYDIGYQSLEQLMREIQGEQTQGKLIIPGIPLSREHPDEVRSYIDVFRKMVAPEN